MNAKNAEILRGLLKLPDNRLCVDCKRNGERGIRKYLFRI